MMKMRASHFLIPALAAIAFAACSPKSSEKAPLSSTAALKPSAPKAPVIKAASDEGSPGISFLSWDTEGGEKAATNLLRAGSAVRAQFRANGAAGKAGGESAWTDAKAAGRRHGSDANISFVDLEAGGARLEWRTETLGRLDLTFFALDAAPTAPGFLRLIFPFDPKVTSTTVLPAEWLDDGTFRLPVVVNAPDWGPMLLAETKGRPVVGRLEGSRSAKIVDLTPRIPGLSAAEPVALTLTPLLLPPPPGLPAASLPLWIAARRGWLNVLQPCARWGEQDKPFSAPPGILGNNVISDPASVSLWFYADQAFFMPEIAPGISVMPLVRRTIDYWLDQRMRRDAAGRPTGEVIGYWDYGDFLDANAGPLIAAWDYVEATGDLDWLRRRIERLEFIADFLARRDVDGDGLVEATQSGNLDTLQQPNRSCAWWDALNCGHKDGYTNALIYRAWRCLADLETEARSRRAGAQPTRDSPTGSRRSTPRRSSTRETGWLAWWKSRDGELHDYASPTLNGLAIEYGLVEPGPGARDPPRPSAQKMRRGRLHALRPGRPADARAGPRGPTTSCPTRSAARKREDGTDTVRPVHERRHHRRPGAPLPGRPLRPRRPDRRAGRPRPAGHARAPAPRRVPERRPRRGLPGHRLDDLGRQALRLRGLPGRQLPLPPGGPAARAGLRARLYRPLDPRSKDQN